jgi:hypothetical protein
MQQNDNKLSARWPAESRERTFLEAMEQEIRKYDWTFIPFKYFPIPNAQACKSFWGLLVACGPKFDAVKLNNSVQRSAWRMFKKVVDGKNAKTMEVDFVRENALSTKLSPRAVKSLNVAEQELLGKRYDVS